VKIAVVGAGAIGGYLGARLALAGEEITCIARGANLAAIRARGLTLIQEDGAEQTAPGVRAVERPADAGAQDVVLLTVKAHQVPGIAADLRPLLAPDTPLVTMQNGIPWWYFHRHGGPFEGRPVLSVDPDGRLASLIEIDRVIGSVVYPASELIAPGIIRLVEGNRFSLGELDGTPTERVRRLSAVLGRAGFKAPVSRDIRGELWLKLWGNLSFNPISALTHATLVDICRYPLTRELAGRMMTEAQAVAGKLGVTFPVPLERRLAGAEKVGAHKTSMLQDVEHGRPLEIEALVGAVVELGQLTGTPTPAIDAVYACASLLARTLANGKGRLAMQTAG
jgi:2-dehydropantoate 2-reductase